MRPFAWPWWLQAKAVSAQLVGRMCVFFFTTSSCLFVYPPRWQCDSCHQARGKCAFPVMDPGDEGFPYGPCLPCIIKKQPCAFSRLGVSRVTARGGGHRGTTRGGGRRPTTRRRSVASSSRPRPPSQAPSVEIISPGPSEPDASSNPEDFLLKLSPPSSYTSSAASPRDLAHWYSLTLSLELEYRAACVARDAASVAFDEAAARANFAYKNRKIAQAEYVAGVEALVDRASPPSTIAAGPSRSRGPTTRQQEAPGPAVPVLKPRAFPSSSVRGKGKAGPSPASWTDADEIESEGEAFGNMDCE